MSFSVTTEIFCDGVVGSGKCMNFSIGYVGEKEYRFGAEDRAIKQGWSQDWENKKKIHLCPVCNGNAKRRLSDGSYVWK
jgi:hypothetical protein